MNFINYPSDQLRAKWKLGYLERNYVDGMMYRVDVIFGVNIHMHLSNLIGIYCNYLIAVQGEIVVR